MSWRHVWEKRKVSEEMAKQKTVKFTYLDGKKVTRSNGVFNLRAPISMTLKGKTSIDLGVSCDHPIMVFESRGMKERGINVVHGCRVYDAGERITLELASMLVDASGLIDIGDVVAHAYVLDNSDITEV